MNNLPSLQAQLASLKAQALSVGVVRAIPLPDPSAASPKQLAYVVVTVPAGSKFPVNISGDYVNLDTIRTSGGGPFSGTLNLIPDSGVSLPFNVGGIGQVIPEPFKFVTLQNLSIDSVTLQFWIGFGRVNNQAFLGTPSSPVITAASLIRSRASMNRPAGALVYAANQVITGGAYSFVSLNITRAGSKSAILVGATLWKNSTVTAAANFRLYLFDGNNAGLVPSVADGAPWTLTNVAEPYFLGVIDFPAFITGGAGSDSALCDIANLELPLDFSSDLPYPLTQSITGVLVALDAYAAAALEQFALTLRVEQL